MNIQCVILAGGLGTRVKQFSPNIPKCLIEINGVPFIDYQLDWISRRGITDVVLCIGHLGHMVRDYVKTGSKWNLHVDYVEDGDKLLGTGGAIRKALEAGVLQDNFLLTYGDSFLPIRFKEVFQYFLNQSHPALMVVYNNQDKFDTSNAIIKNGLVYYDKFSKSHPNHNFSHIDYGLSALKKEIIEKYIPTNIKYDLATLFHNLSLELKLAGYETNNRFYEIGSPGGLKEFIEWNSGGCTIA